MGMILRIASSRIVGQGDIVGRSGYFSLNLSANSVMRGRLDARRTLKSLVADLRLNNCCLPGGVPTAVRPRHFVPGRNSNCRDGNDAAGFGISWGNPTIISPDMDLLRKLLCKSLSRYRMVRVRFIWMSWMFWLYLQCRR